MAEQSETGAVPRTMAEGKEMYGIITDSKLPYRRDLFTLHWPNQTKWPCLTSKGAGEYTPAK